MWEFIQTSGELKQVYTWLGAAFYMSHVMPARAHLCGTIRPCLQRNITPSVDWWKC